MLSEKQVRWAAFKAFLIVSSLTGLGYVIIKSLMNGGL